MASQNDNRLDRIEEKIDRLADAMVAFARAEEKLINLENKYSTHYERMNRFSEKLDNVEKKVNENSHTVSTINKLFWIAAVAAIGAAATNIWM